MKKSCVLAGLLTKPRNSWISLRQTRHEFLQKGRQLVADDEDEDEDDDLEKCDACGEDSDSGDKFCSECGADLSDTEKRKLADYPQGRTRRRQHARTRRARLTFQFPRPLLRHVCLLTSTPQFLTRPKAVVHPASGGGGPGRAGRVE